MHCGNCTKTDGIVYMSNPPKLKCTVTGEFHGYGDECDCGVEHPKFYTKCLVCGELAEISNVRLPVRICDKCRAAIRYIRDNFTEK